MQVYEHSAFALCEPLCTHHPSGTNFSRLHILCSSVIRHQQISLATVTNMENLLGTTRSTPNACFDEIWAIILVFECLHFSCLQPDCCGGIYGFKSWCFKNKTAPHKLQCSNQTLTGVPTPGRIVYVLCQLTSILEHLLHSLIQLAEDYYPFKQLYRCVERSVRSVLFCGFFFGEWRLMKQALTVAALVHYAAIMNHPSLHSCNLELCDSPTMKVCCT